MSTWTVEGAGVPLAVSEEGDGPPVLVLHAMGSDRLAWAERQAALAAGGRRAIVPDRRGYGDSGAPVPYVGTTVEEQAEDAAAVLRTTTEEPALVVGEGFGALVALDLVRRHRAAVRAVVLGHPPLFSLVPEADHALAAEQLELNTALRDHGPAGAVAEWLGPGIEPARMARAKAAHLAFFADYAGQSTWSATRRELRGLDAPAVVVTHRLAPDHVVLAADRLAELLPDARRDTGGDLVAAALSAA